MQQMMKVGSTSNICSTFEGMPQSHLRNPHLPPCGCSDLVPSHVGVVGGGGGCITLRCITVQSPSYLLVDTMTTALLGGA